MSHEMERCLFKNQYPTSLFYLSVLVYNMWVLLNLIRRISGYGWITLMDFIISMGRRCNIIMKGNGWSTVKANKLQAFDVH